MTLSAANVAVAWTQDLGGFYKNDSTDTPPGWLHDEEMYLRWLQFGVFSPSFRTHCSHCDPRIWSYSNFELLRQTFLLRNRLMPYIYTAAYQTYQTGITTLYPLYYEYSDNEEAYTYSTYRGPGYAIEYLFGENIFITPITSAVDSKGKAYHLDGIWFPPGF